MAICKSYGKDKVFFVTAEYHATPSTVLLPELEPQQGPITDAGDINWGCPCLGNVATGPCNVEFRQSYACFHYSTTQGYDCYNAFKAMNDCFKKFPALYKNLTIWEEDTELDKNVQESCIEADQSISEKKNNT